MIKMSDKFDEFLERLEGPLPEPRTKPLPDSLIGAQALCSGFAVCCAQFAAHFLNASSSCRQ